MKYKLIKTYPGSPELGTIVSGENKTAEWMGTNFYKKYPEYWEEVNEHLWWVVFIKEEASFKTYTPYKIESIYAPWETDRYFFKTKEEAEQYIIKNKPCLTLNDVGLILGGLERKRDVFLELKRIVKSKL